MSEDQQLRPTAIAGETVIGYWREFLRVNFDKIILFILIVMMLTFGADEKLVYLTVGILGGAVVHNRWQRNP